MQYQLTFITLLVNSSQNPCRILLIDSNRVYPNARLWSMDALGLIYGINSIVRTNIGERRRSQIVCSNHRYCLDERATTVTRPRDDVCTHWSGVGDLEGMD